MSVSSDRERPVALIALGSNLGDSPALIRNAFERLSPYSSAPVRTSSLWQSVPVDCPPGSPPFINAAALIVPYQEETPESLLAKLQQLETEFGRVPKTVLNEARPLDLDLIAFGAAIRNSPALTLPHPRAHLRRFVLAPMSEIAPDFVLPGIGRSVTQLLYALPGTDDVRRM